MIGWRRAWMAECGGLGLALTQIAPPAANVLSTEEGRGQLRLTPTFGTSPPSHPEDALIDDAIRAATDELDGPTGWLGRALVSQTWRMSLDRFPNRRMVLPMPPLQSVESISYLDSDGVSTVLDPSAYEVRNSFSLGSPITATPEVGYVDPAYGTSWPSAVRRAPGAVTVEFVCGYGDPADVPPLIKQFLRVRLGFYYENRESTVVGAGITSNELPGYGGLLENFRIRGLLPK